MYPYFFNSTQTTVCSIFNLGYSYGFNGKEKDNEINVSGGDYDFGERIFDGRLGRWLSIDPLFSNYSSLTPYNFSNNSPNLFLDPDGRTITIYYKNSKGIFRLFEKQKEIIYDPNVPYTGNNEFVKSVYDSYNFIRENNADDKGVILGLCKSTTNFRIEKARFSKFDYMTNTIYWSAKGLDVGWGEQKEGSYRYSTHGYQSAATGLFHETAHAFNFLTKYKLNIKLYEQARKQYTENDNDYAYDDPEEKDVIDNYETPLILKLNAGPSKDNPETIRNNHEGGQVAFKEVTSIKKDNSKKDKVKKTEKANGG